MRILVTGAAGFIGSHLVDLLLEEGIPAKSLRLLVHNKESLSNLPNKNFEIIRGDIREKDIVKKIVEGVNVIYHLAARTDFEGKTFEDYKDVNVESTKNLLQASKKQKLQKFVFFSSIAVFGLPAGVGDIISWDETHPPTYTNLYGKSKWEGEEAVRDAYKKWGIPYAIIRPASVYGPKEKGPTFALYKAIKNHQFIMIGNGENKMHYVYVGDLVKGAREAQLSRKKNGEYILAGSTPTTLKEVAKFVAESIGEKIPSWYIPKELALILSFGAEAFGKMIGVKSPFYPSRVKTMTAAYYYNIDRAKKEIGYDPQTSFKEGTEITGKWYLENGWL